MSISRKFASVRAIVDQLKTTIDQLKTIATLDAALDLLAEDLSLLPSLGLKPHNFRIDSTDWSTIVVNGRRYRQNPEGDIWEIVDGPCAGEQLFTWDAAVRETAKVNERMLTNEEWSRLAKEAGDIPNLTFPGYRSSDGTFHYPGTNACIWSLSENGTDAWRCYLHVIHSSYGYKTDSKAYGFSVRCLRD